MNVATALVDAPRNRTLADAVVAEMEALPAAILPPPPRRAHPPHRNPTRQLARNPGARRVASCLFSDAVAFPTMQTPSKGERTPFRRISWRGFPNGR